MTPTNSFVLRDLSARRPRSRGLVRTRTRRGGGDATRISVIRGLTLARPVGWLFRNSRQVGRARGHAPNRFWVATPWRQDQLIPREGSRPRGGSRERAVYPPGPPPLYTLARYSPSINSGLRGRAGRIATQGGPLSAIRRLSSRREPRKK